MLTYLINVTDDFLALSVVIGVMASFIYAFCGDRGRRIFSVGILLGMAMAGYRAYITNTRRIAGSWRIGTYGNMATVAVFLVAVLAAAVLLHRLSREKGEKKPAVAECVISGTAGLLAAMYLYGVLYTIYYYPFGFTTTGDTALERIFNTDFLFRLGGYLLGLLVCLTTILAVRGLLNVYAKKGYRAVNAVCYFLLTTLYTVKLLGKLGATLTTRKMIESDTIFRLSVKSNNNAAVYTYIFFGVMVVLSIGLWILSFTAKEPYRNPAERRKQRSVWRNGRRHTAAVLVCAVLAVLCTTWFVTLNTVVITEAPMEEPIVIKDASGAETELRVMLSSVSDGHLHRFGYTTSDGTVARFIVVLKTEGTTNYGVGLDACDICGEAGYYENDDGQVVCKKCNVVMNKTTIGMNGGCNPIIIDYDINESYITVPVSEMERCASKFK